MKTRPGSARQGEPPFSKTFLPFWVRTSTNNKSYRKFCLAKKEIYLLRHGDTGLTGKFVGSSDVGLSDKGRAQIAASALPLSSLGIERVFCSPLLRCRQSLELLDLELPTTISDNLREIDFGHWERRTFQDIAIKYRSDIELWKNDYRGFAFPGGEAVAGFIQRVTEISDELREIPESKVLVVSHGGVIRHLLCLLLLLPFESYLAFDIKTGKYTSLDLFEGGAALTGLNL